MLIVMTLVMSPSWTSVVCSVMRRMSWVERMRFYSLIFLKIDFRKRKGGGEREREKEALICCSIHLYIHWLSPACALIGDPVATLVYQDDALTNSATQPGPYPYPFQPDFKKHENRPWPGSSAG